MQWEFSFLYALQELHNPVLDKIMIFITTLGDEGLFWIGIGIVCLVIKKHRRMGLQVLLSMLVTFIVGNLILKFIFNFLKFKCVLFNNLFLLDFPFSIIESVLL